MPGLRYLAIVGRRVVETYRRRWEVEEFVRLLKVGLRLESFQVRGLSQIRKVVAVLRAFSPDKRLGCGPSRLDAHFDVG